MNVVRFPTPERKLSILDGAPQRTAESSFMGLMETVAWVGLRDDRAALAARWHSLDRPDFDQHWVGACLILLNTDIAARDGSLKAVQLSIIDHCASGALQAKGRGRDGFHDIPANDWLGATLFSGAQPDSVLCAGWSGAGWTHVQFLRSDVLKLWPANLAPDLADEAPPKRKTTRPKPQWYPALRGLFEDEERRHAEWPEKHPGSLPPRYRTAADYRRLLLNMKFSASLVRPSTVRHHLRALKEEFGR